MKPIIINFSFLFALAALFIGKSLVLPAQQHGAIIGEEWVCLPCGRDCDKQTYAEPGRCPHCQMERVKKSSVTFTNLPPDDVCHYIEVHPAAVLLDVRTKEEFEGKADPDYGRLKNAINIPVQELNDRITELDSLKGKEILVYCSHSHRSPQASYVLTQRGFNHITNMLGGMSVVKDSPCKEMVR